MKLLLIPLVVPAMLLTGIVIVALLMAQWLILKMAETMVACDGGGYA
jgi:hypothetical protein